MMASRLKIWEVNCVPCHCTRMYPMALMCLFNFHYLASTLPHFRTCWNHHVDLLCQNRCGSRRNHSYSPGQRWCRFLLWIDEGCLPPHWILPYCSTSARRPVNQSRVTTQWGGAVFPISNQREQWVGAPVNQNKPELMTNLHTEAHLGEGCIPVGW